MDAPFKPNSPCAANRDSTLSIVSLKSLKHSLDPIELVGAKQARFSHDSNSPSPFHNSSRSKRLPNASGSSSTALTIFPKAAALSNESLNNSLALRSGGELNGIDDYISAVKRISDTSERQQYQIEILGLLLHRDSVTREQIERFCQYIKSDPGGQDLMNDSALAPLWDLAHEICADQAKKRDKKEEALSAISKAWGVEVKNWLRSLDSSIYFLTQVRSIALQENLINGSQKVNQAMLHRICASAAGVSNKWQLQATDFKCGPKFPIKKITSEELRTFNLCINQFGFLVPKAWNERAIESSADLSYGGSESCDSSSEPEGDSAIAAANLIGSSDFSSPAQEIDGSRYATDHVISKVGAIDKIADRNPLAQSEASSESQNESMIELQSVEAIDDDPSSDNLDGPGQDPFETAISNGESDSALSDASDASDQRSAALTHAINGSSNPIRVHYSSSAEPSTKRPCEYCSVDVSSAWIASMKPRKIHDPAKAPRLLKQWIQFKSVCFNHSKSMGGHIGLCVKPLNHSALQKRLRYISDHIERIGELKTNEDTYQWFRVQDRPARPEDGYGPYNFAHTPLPSEFDFNQSEILDWINRDFNGGFDKLQWERDGSVNVNLFSWWWEPGCEMGEFALELFDVYQFHLREQNGKENYGWLRNMFFSTCQQAMRSDPLYYALYAALRPDGATTLCSYPYYAKYTHKGDQTYFRHIDINVPEWIKSNRGGNMIQGSLSLDDEQESDCTVILAGMHRNRNLETWWRDLESRQKTKNGHVHRIKSNMVTAEDEKKLGVKWKAVPCNRGQVRVTMPHLPHGANGPARGVRRTLLPWFVKVQPDLSSLEVLDGGTWEMLSESHRDMTSPFKTPSGLSNRYGKIPYQFPASTLLNGLGSLSSALNCQARWNDLGVLNERYRLLKGNRSTATQFVYDWRRNLNEKVKASRALVKERERAAFGKNSYYYHLERSQTLGISMPHLAPDKPIKKGDKEGDSDDIVEGEDSDDIVEGEWAFDSDEGEGNTSIDSLEESNESSTIGFNSDDE